MGLEYSAKERHRPVKVGPEEGKKNAQRAGTPLLWRQTETAGVVQPGEEKVLRRSHCGLPILKGGFLKRVRVSFYMGR